jgi:hypothetical protein
MSVNLQDSIRQTAEGMIRNYQHAAARQAEAIAARMGGKAPEGQKLWSSVAREIRFLQAQS